MRENRPADEDVVVLEDEAIQGDGDGLVQASLRQLRDLAGGNGAEKGERLRLVPAMVVDAMSPGTQSPGNLFVPVDLLKPILAELRSRGASRASTRPWLGLQCDEFVGHVRVIRLTPASPAEDAGLEPGDLILAIDGTEVADLASFYKALWREEQAEREVALEVKRGADSLRLTVRAVDRMKTLSRPQGV